MGIGLQVYSKLMGINTLIYYGPTVIKKFHFSNNTSPTFPIKTYVPMAAIYTFRFTNFHNFLYFFIKNILLKSTALATFLIDKYGKRATLLFFVPGDALGMFGIATGIILKSSDIWNVDGFDFYGYLFFLFSSWFFFRIKLFYNYYFI